LTRHFFHISLYLHSFTYQPLALSLCKERSKGEGWLYHPQPPPSISASSIDDATPLRLSCLSQPFSLTPPPQDPLLIVSLSILLWMMRREPEGNRLREKQHKCQRDRSARRVALLHFFPRFPPSSFLSFTFFVSLPHKIHLFFVHLSSFLFLRSSWALPASLSLLQSTPTSTSSCFGVDSSPPGVCGREEAGVGGCFEKGERRMLSLSVSGPDFSFSHHLLFLFPPFFSFLFLPLFLLCLRMITGCC